MHKHWAVVTAAALLGAVAVAPTQAAQVTVPHTSATVPMTATVTEQADITLPAGITWTVDDVEQSTASAPATVTINKIKLANGKALRVSLQATAAEFTPPTGGTVTWSAADVSWASNGATWTNAAARPAGALSSSAYTTLVETTANAAECSTTNLVFQLAPKPGVDRAGAHTLNVTWKMESF